MIFQTTLGLLMQDHEGLEGGELIQGSVLLLFLVFFLK